MSTTLSKITNKYIFKRVIKNVDCIFLTEGALDSKGRRRRKEGRKERKEERKRKEEKESVA